MRIFLLLLFLCLSGIAQSQMEMNREARKDFEKADAQLNKVYQKVLAESDSESQQKLKVSQRSWMAFRDAEADFAADAEARGGSLAPLIYSSTQAALTKERTTALKKLLEPAQ